MTQQSNSDPDQSGIPELTEWLDFTIRILSTYRQKLSDPVIRKRAEESKINSQLKEVKTLINALENPNDYSAQAATFGVQQKI